MSSNDRNGIPAFSPREHNYQPPRVAEPALARPRLDALFAQLLAEHGALEVVAGPGYGKTTQTLLYARREFPDQTAWLTLTVRENSALNLVYALASALDKLVTDEPPINAAEIVSQALQQGASTDEAAALLASAVAGRRLLIVLDECEHLSDTRDAFSVLDTFLTLLTENVHAVLLSRRQLPWLLPRQRVEGHLGTITGGPLVMTLSETTEFLAVTGADTDNAEQVHEFSVGWAVAVAICARYGVPTSETALQMASYIDTQVLDLLPDDEQTFLLSAAVIGTVKRDSAVAVFGNDTHRLWGVARDYQLPGLFVSEDAMNFESLLRVHLVDRLLRARPELHDQILRRYAEHLSITHHFEQATDTWLKLGEYDLAAATADDAADSMCECNDWATILDWGHALGEQRVLEKDRLAAAWVRAIHGDRQFDRAEMLVRRLDSDGRLGSLLERNRVLLAPAAWALQSDPPAALDLLNRFRGDHRADAVRFMFETVTNSGPASVPYGHSWDEAERAMTWGLILQGRVRDAAALTPADPDAPILNPTVVLATVFCGDWSGASAAWARVPVEIRDRPQSRFIEAILHIVAHEYDSADTLLRLAISDSQRTGFGLTLAYEVFASYVMMSMGAVDQARELLLRILTDSSGSKFVAYLEWAKCLLGIVELRQDRVDEAEALLQHALDSMQRSNRLLFLPLAAVALSEAQFRAGRSNDAHESAELALKVSTTLGNFTGLNWGLHIFDDVRRREMTNTASHSRWRRLEVGSTHPEHRISVQRDGVSIVAFLQPFGRKPDLIVNDVPARVGRVKLLELVACLARQPAGIDRYHLQDLLFPEASPHAAANHFRQIIHRLRRQTGIDLQRDGDLLRFADDIHLITADVEFERMLASANGLPYAERITVLTEALEPVTGPYLEGSTLAWADEHRNHLGLLQEEAQLELATLHFQAGNYETAKDLCVELLARNPYSDPAYRLRIAIERKHGTETSVTGIYQRAQEALAELGLKPGDARRLLNVDVGQSPSGPAPSSSRRT